MRLLKQSTAQTVKLGQFVDDTDGATAETALTIAQADIRVSKDGGAFAQTSNTAGATHDENGWYNVPLDATDTGTLGELVVYVDVAGALYVRETFTVVPAHVYDGLVPGTDFLQVDAQQVGGATPDTATDIADQTWDEARADHVAAGSMGENMADQSNLSNLDATVSTRSSHAAADVVTVPLSELAQAKPSATPTLEDALMLLYMAMRNAETQTASEYAITNDAGVVIAKAALSDDGVTVTKAEMVTGP